MSGDTKPVGATVMSAVTKYERELTATNAIAIQDPKQKRGE